VQWQGVEWRIVLSFAVIWEVLYQAGKRLAARSYADYPKVVTQGASYFTAFLNACFCASVGAYVIVSLSDAPDVDRVILNEEVSHFYQVSLAAYYAAMCFLGWLLMDMVHLLTHFPVLGGVDMLLHHAGFSAVALLGMGFRFLPLVVGWLLLGELSSIFLNARWLLINTDRGASRALHRCNVAFAITFFCTRVLLFWSGLAHLLLVERPLLLAPPFECPPWAVNTLAFFLVGGALLNAFWMVKIIKMALKPPPSRPHSSSRRRICEKAILHSPKLSSESSLSDLEACSDLSESPGGALA